MSVRSAHFDFAGRFTDKTAPTDSGCVEWIGCIGAGGYGTLTFQGKAYKAHRAAWIMRNGEIPQGLKVCHTCDNPKCVNPAHLFLGTQRDNVRDMINKGRFRVVPQKGEKHPGAKLTDGQVRDIRARYQSGLGYRLAAEFGVSRMTITRVVLRQLWKEVA